MKVFNEPRKKLLNSNALTQTLKTTGKTSIYWNNQTKLCIWTRRILTPTGIPIKDASTRPISGAFLFSHLKASGQTPDKTEGKEAPKLRKEIPPQFSFFLFVVFGRRIRRHISFVVPRLIPREFISRNGDEDPRERAPCHPGRWPRFPLFYASWFGTTELFRDIYF